MKVSSIKTGLSALLLAALLAGCSSNPAVEEQPTSTDIEDTSVQTGQVDASEIEEAAVETITADTVFYFDFDKALLKPESRAALLEHAAILQSSPRMFDWKAMPMSAEPASTTWPWVSDAHWQSRNSWYSRAYHRP